jgi:hypothetical protein
MEDGWIRAAGEPGIERTAPVNCPFNIISVHFGRMR